MKNFFCIFLLCLILFVSCSQKGATGVIGSSLILPTHTPTQTPAVNFVVNIHANNIPFEDVNLLMTHVQTGITLSAKTYKSGLGEFLLNYSGKWKLDIAGVKGFDPASFIVEPEKNNFFKVDYGTPWIELKVLSGNIKIPLKESKIQLEAIYHTKMSKPGDLSINLPEGIKAEPSTASVRADNDRVTYTITIKKSFENYSKPNGEQDIMVNCSYNINESIISNPITIIKNWSFIVTGDYMFAAVYDYPDNGHHTSYYAQIRNLYCSTSGDGLLKGKVKASYVSASHWGNAHITVIEPNNCLPGFTNYGCFEVGAKLKTDFGWSYASGNYENNGSLTVRFTDDGDLDVERTFLTNNGWGETCSWYCCIYTGVPFNQYFTCGTVPPGGACQLGMHFEPNSIWRCRVERITINK